jgi:hypothetical protein
MAAVSDPISRGSIQTIALSVYDASSNHIVKVAMISGIVKYASGSTQKSFAGSTDDNGHLSYTWRIGGSSTPGVFEILVKVSALGYEPTTASILLS